MTHAPAHSRSPTAALVIGLLITLGTVVVYSSYITGQIAGLRRLQTELTDRNRRDTLQLLRIQNDLNQLALAMRDMLDTDQRYPLIAWTAQFGRIRADLEDALAREEAIAVARRTPEQQRYLASSMAQFWDALDRIFDLAKAGREDEARTQIRVSLQARQAALSTAVARLLVQNNEAEEQTARQVAGHLPARAAPGLLVPRRDARRDRGDRALPDSLQPPAVRRAVGAVRPAARPRAEADRDAGIDACVRSPASCTTSSASC